MGRETTITDVFVSRTGRDSEWAQWIAWVLEEAGYTTVLQDWDFLSGQNFVLRMQEAATTTRHTLAVLSQGYLDARYTQSEWAAAFAADPKSEGRKLICVRVRECEPEGLLKASIYIDLVGLEETAAKKKLVAEIGHAVKGDRRKPGTRPAFPGRPRPPFPTTSGVVFSLPHPRNPNFTGREGILGAMRGALREGGPAAFTGLGGVGKTQLALEYAYRYRGSYEVVWWVRSEEPAQLASDYAGLAAPLDLPEKALADQTSIVQAVRAWLAGHPAWLVVFDNAPEAQAVYDYLPRGGAGHVLITSCNQTWGAVARPVEVPEFPRTESVEFLHKRTGQMEGTDDLAEALGDFPLALEHAAAYAEATGCTLGGYLDLFRTRRKELWSKVEPPPGYHATITTTWVLAVDQVREECPAAADLLSLCAFFAPADIPFFLLRQGARGLRDSLARAVADPLALDEALASLRRYSLAKVEGEALCVHRLVQAVTQDRLSEDDRRKRAAAACYGVSTTFPYEEHDPTTWPASARLLRHALAAAQYAEESNVEPERVSYLLNQVGLYLKNRVDLLPARSALERSLAIAERVHGAESAVVALHLSNLGSVLFDLEDPRGAVMVTMRALAIAEKSLDPEDPLMALFLNNLGRVLHALGDLGEARKHIARALTVAERVQGPEHPHMARYLYSLGLVEKDSDDLKGARKLVTRALKIDEQVYGLEHPYVARDVHCLALVLRALGYVKAARRRLARALKIDERAYGPEHPVVAGDLDSLADVLVDLKDPSGARAHYERALGIFQARLGEEHTKTKLVREKLERLGRGER